jgi:MHS family shikimate/dehydroshikimate transporter-like MFS transporter
MDSTLISSRPGKETCSLNRARRAAWGSFAGAVVDWYDFLLYGITAALVFNREFFPQISPAMGTLAAFATFGVGFLFRPLGGIIFGHFGDRLGRKRMLMMTVWMMGIATACIGLLLLSIKSAGGPPCCSSPYALFRASPSAENGAARRCWQ